VKGIFITIMVLGIAFLIANVFILNLPDSVGINYKAIAFSLFLAITGVWGIYKSLKR
jgi:hypothetical protein